MSEDELTALFIGEIEVGILMDAELSDTGGFDPDTWTEIRAGQIKTALEPEFTKLHAKLFASAARAATKTGAPIMVHIEQGADPVGLADFMEKRGVCSDQMIFCHMDRAVSDPAVHRELCGRGIYLEYDTVAREKYHSDEDEISIVMERIIEGFGDKLLMSLDVTRERLVGYGGTVGLDYMQRCFIPRMRDAGVCAETIKKIFIENPRRAFSI
jgi:phosphotriesterase-related protein